MAAEDASTFGTLLRQHRIRAGLTQERLAERAQMSARGLLHLERDTRRPYPDTLHRLAEALSLTPAQRDTLADAAHAPVSAPTSPTPQITSSPAPTSLIGRDRELAVLRNRLVSVRARQGSLVLIGGEAGIGKTALAEAILREAAAQGYRAFEGHCFDLAETPPYGPFIDLFLHLPPSAALPPLPPAFTERGTVGSVPGQMALFAQMLDFLTALARRQPVVVLLDDLHWADPASLDLLRFLSRSVSALPLLILATYRSDEVTRRHPLAPLLPQLARDAGVERIALGRLEDAAVRTLLVDRYGLPAGDVGRLAIYVQGRAEGNALFVGELLRALEEGGTLRRDAGGWALGALDALAVPPLLRQVIEGRVARLDEESQRLLAAAAVIGHDVPLAVWATVGETDEDALLNLAERAEEANLLVGAPDGTRVRFAHALIREALYGGTPSVRRRRLHRAAGEALAALPNPDADAVAHHFRMAGDARTALWLARAGERARAAHAYVTAVERMREAVALLDKPEDAAQAASLCVQIGYMLQVSDRPPAIRYAEEAVRRAERADDPVLLGVARCRLGSNLWFDRQFTRGIAALRAGVAELEALPPTAWERTATPRWYVTSIEGDRSSATDVRAALAHPLAIVGAFGEALALLGGTLDLDDTTLATASLDKLLALRHVADALGRPDVAKRAYEEAGHILRAAEDWYRLGNQNTGFLARTVLPYHADNLAYREEEASTAHQAWGRAQALDLVAPFPLRAVRFPLDFIAGDWDAAQAHAAAMQPLGGPLIHITMLALGTIARLQGRPEQARQYLQAWLPEGPATEPGARPLMFGLEFLCLGGLLALDAGDLDAARAWAEASDHWLAWSGAVRGLAEGQALWARYHRQAGKTDRAFEHAARALAHATAPRQPLALIAAHRLVGELNADIGRYAEANQHLQESLALADVCQAPYERASTMLAMAEVKAATGKTEAAKTLLNEVVATCTTLNAVPLLAQATALSLRSSG